MTRSELDKLAAHGSMYVAVLVAWDAFRLCLGGKPQTFSKGEVIAWINSFQ